MKKIAIKIPSCIVENRKIEVTEKLLLDLFYSYDKKKGYTILTNNEIGELFKINTNTVGKYISSLLKKEFIVKQKGKIEITEKYKSYNSTERREIIIPNAIYELPINVGSKLLWGEYNSLSNKGKRDSNASRDYYRKRLGCSADSITNWHNELHENNLIESSLKGGQGKRQRVVKTKDFSTDRIYTSTIPKKRRDEIWKEYIPNKHRLKKNLENDKDVYEFIINLSEDIKIVENKEEVISALLYNLESKLNGNNILKLLKDNLRTELNSI